MIMSVDFGEIQETEMKFLKTNGWNIISKIVVELDDLDDIDEDLLEQFDEQINDDGCYLVLNGREKEKGEKQFE